MTIEITVDGMPLACYVQRSEYIAKQRYARRFFNTDDYWDFERYCLDVAEHDMLLKHRNDGNADRREELRNRIHKYQRRYNIELGRF